MFMNLSPSVIGIDVNQREAVRLASIGDFDGVDLFIEEAVKLSEEFSTLYVKSLFDCFEVKVGPWMIPSGWNGDESVYKESLRKLEDYAAVGSAVGSVRAITWVSSWSDERAYADNFSWHVERLTPVAKILRKFDCRLGLEFLGPVTLRQNHKYEFIHTIEQMLQLCEEIPVDNVGLLLDSWHWYTSGGTLDDLNVLNNENVVAVHINDAPEGVPIDKQQDGVRVLPGESGVIDLDGFLNVLERIGYDGPVTPEPFSKKIKGMPNELAVRMTGGYLLKVWNRCLEKDSDLA